MSVYLQIVWKRSSDKETPLQKSKCPGQGNPQHWHTYLPNTTCKREGKYKTRCIWGHEINHLSNKCPKKSVPMMTPDQAKKQAIVDEKFRKGKVCRNRYASQNKHILLQTEDTRILRDEPPERPEDGDTATSEENGSTDTKSMEEGLPTRRD